MRSICLFLISLLLFSAAGSFAAELQKPDKNDRCPVCGMFVAPYPDWLATLVFIDGAQLYFDGPKDLFRYYYSLPNKNDSRSRDEIAGIYLTDYYSTRLLSVEQVFLILGSNVYGPMGKELIPVAGEEAAKTFLRDHDGEQMIRFEQLTPNLLPGD